MHHLQPGPQPLGLVAVEPEPEQAVLVHRPQRVDVGVPGLVQRGLELRQPCLRQQRPQRRQVGHRLARAGVAPRLARAATKIIA
jgi:hypothetical protein